MVLMKKKNELAYYIKKYKQAKRELDFYKYLNKKQEQELKELEILLSIKLNKRSNKNERKL